MFIDENNLLYSFGRPEHGQLGHNTDGQYFVTSNKLAFDCEVLPRHVAVYVEKTKDGFTHIIDDVKVTDVSCGNNHTVKLLAFKGARNLTFLQPRLQYWKSYECECAAGFTLYACDI